VQVRLTGGIQQMLPSFLPSFLFAAPVVLDKLVLDDERHILYSLGANSAIQVRCWSPAALEQAMRPAVLPSVAASVQC
jgi:hypothetical protein